MPIGDLPLERCFRSIESLGSLRLAADFSQFHMNDSAYRTLKNCLEECDITVDEDGNPHNVMDSVTYGGAKNTYR